MSIPNNMILCRNPRVCGVQSHRPGTVAPCMTVTPPSATSGSSLLQGTVRPQTSRPIPSPAPQSPVGNQSNPESPTTLRDRLNSIRDGAYKNGNESAYPFAETGRENPTPMQGEVRPQAPTPPPAYEPTVHTSQSSLDDLMDNAQAKPRQSWRAKIAEGLAETQSRFGPDAADSPIGRSAGSERDASGKVSWFQRVRNTFDDLVIQSTESSAPDKNVDDSWKTRVAGQLGVQVSTPDQERIAESAKRQKAREDWWDSRFSQR